MPARPARRRVCFVTGTRAEFGLMRSTLDAIRAHPSLDLQIVVTGMHLHRAHGNTINDIRKDGWRVDATVPWPASTSPTPVTTAAAMGGAVARLPSVFGRLKTDVVLVVGDRVEAFAAAAAGHVSGLAVAHVHGGDRALGQVDDALRHAITKLAHVHFPATVESAGRIRRLGEDRWRIHRVGSPGIDGIRRIAATRDAIKLAFPLVEPGRFALLVLHPTTADDVAERRAARRVLQSVLSPGVPHVVIVHPNNDPGGRGIAAAWDDAAAGDARNPGSARLTVRRDIPRSLFLGLMRDAAVLVGNSSSGIIEAATFGTPVVDIGSRQAGRERSGNVVNVPPQLDAVAQAVAKIWRGGRPRRWRGRNVYGGEGAGARIAAALARLSVDEGLLRKLIAY